MKGDLLVRTKHRAFGFTLIELMIVIVILGVLVSYAIPTYRQYVIEGCRKDAMVSLEKIANEQEQFYFDNNNYANRIDLLPVQADSTEDHYDLTTQRNGGGNTFVAQAVQDPNSTCLPANDIQYRITDTGVRQRSLDNGVNWIDKWE